MHDPIEQLEANNKLLEEHISRHNIGASLNRDKLNDTGDIEDISEDDMSCDEGMDMGSEYEDMPEGNNNESEYEEIECIQGDVRTERKCIFFLPELIQLFPFCHFCKADHPELQTWSVGSMLVVETTCLNQDCRKIYTWRCQPDMPNTKIPAGNLLLSFAILLTGGSPAKFLRAFEQINLSAISLATFYRHQKEFLFPTIQMHWESYQTSLLAKLTDRTGYIGSVFESLLVGIAEEKLELYKKKIEVMTPAPMHSVLQKEDKMTALDKFITRQSLITTEVPPTSQPGIDDIHHLLFSN
eukprot:gene13302-14675_t